MKEYIESITPPRVWAATLVFLALVGPVFFALFRYRPDLIQSLDLAKLILLCISISLPFLAANAFLVVVFLPGFSQSAIADKKEQAVLWLLAAAMTTVVFYSVIIESFVNSYSLKVFAYRVCYRQLSVGLGLVLIYYLNKWRKRKANQALLPTPTAVTSPAGQDPRQP
jgi:hypothetical protein